MIWRIIFVGMGEIYVVILDCVVSQVLISYSFISNGLDCGRSKKVSQDKCSVLIKRTFAFGTKIVTANCIEIKIYYTSQSPAH